MLITDAEGTRIWMELCNSIVADGRITEFQIPIARDILPCLIVGLSEDNRFVFST
jgi:hypothetical protein